MDILDFFWTFYLNHLIPLWGYFCLPKLELASVEARQTKEEQVGGYALSNSLFL